MIDKEKLQQELAAYQSKESKENSKLKMYPRSLSQLIYLIADWLIINFIWPYAFAFATWYFSCRGRHDWGRRKYCRRFNCWKNYRCYSLRFLLSSIWLDFLVKAQPNFSPEQLLYQSMVASRILVRLFFALCVALFLLINSLSWLGKMIIAGTIVGHR